MAEFNTSKCLFDPAKFGGNKKIQDVYPESSVYEEFTESSDEEIKIAILISDINSPFLKITENKQRVISVFDYLNINRKEKKGSYLFELVEQFNHQRIFEICALYMQIQNNVDFTHWWNLSQLYFSLMSEMGKPKLKDEDINKYVSRKLSIEKQSEEIKQKLKDIEVELFGSSEMKMSIARAKLKKVRTYAEMHSVPSQVE